jgi:RHS repeat-associated protein
VSYCVTIYDEVTQVAEDCELNYWIYDTGPITVYTPADQPHPLYDYAINKFPSGGSGRPACIQPYPHKDGDPPALEPEDQLGEDESNKKEDHLEGDPISIYNGNNVHSETDIKLPTPFTRGLEIKRYYNSRITQEDLDGYPDTPTANIRYGFGWTNSYNAILRYVGGWSYPSHAPLEGCDPDLFQGYIFHRYYDVMDETGHTNRFGRVCGDELRGEYTSFEFQDDKWGWRRLDGSFFVFGNPYQEPLDPYLTEIIDPHGNRQVLIYDSERRLETVTDEATGQVLTFHYNTEGMLDHVSGPVTEAVADGVWVRYGYDDIKNLTSVSYPDGSGYIYEYDDPNDPHNLTTKRDINGNFIFGWTYDDQDRAISNTTNGDDDVTIDYVDGSTVDVTNAYAVTTSHTLAMINNKKHITTVNGPVNCRGCGKDVVRYGHDEQGWVTEIEYVNGRIDQYAYYDARGNAHTEILDAGGLNEVTVQYDFHPTLNQPLRRTQTSVLGSGDKETIWDYDDDGNDTPNENPTSMVHRLIERGFTLDASGSTVPYEYITSMTYNAKGQVTAINGPRPGDDDAVSYCYDSTTGNLAAMTQPHVGTTAFAEYDDAGNLTLMIDPNGVETSFTYDGRNRLLTTTRNGATASTVYTERGKPDSVTDPAGRTLDFVYDAANHLERIVDPAGNFRHFQYDALGNPAREALFVSGSSPEDDGEQTRRFDYGDPLASSGLMAGKPWKTIRPNHDDSAELETVFGYDDMGNVTSVTDARTNTTAHQYDAFGRLKCTEQPGVVVTEFGYDTHGNLKHIIDPEGLETMYFYDDMGRLVKTDSPDTGVTILVYDEAGNMVHKDQNGTVTTHSYDGLNRLTDTLYADGTPGVSLTYDSGSGNYLKGRLASVSDASGGRSFSYDANGFLDTEQRVINGAAYITDYDFDAAGNLRAMVYPTGQVVNFLPDSVDVGRIGTVQIDPGGGVQDLANGLAYKPFGPMTAMNLGNGVSVSLSYDRNYQAAGITAGSVFDRSYVPDGAGNIETIADNIDSSRSQSFGYDALNRLTDASGVYGNIGYTYDRTGNRLTRTDAQGTDTYTYIPGSNQPDTMTGSETIYFDHDVHGNLVGRAFVDGSGQGSGADIPDYTYTHDGQRVVKSVGGQRTVYHYDLAGQLIAETDGDGNLIKAYVWLHGQPLAQVSAGGAVYYYHNDHLGTPQRMTDASGTVVWAVDYLPFGQADVTVGTVVNNLRFAGQYYDAETGLHYNYHRYYDPKLGRYLRADPIGLAGGINLYAYVQNNPVNFIDPDGLMAQKLIKLSKKLYGKILPRAAGKDPRVKIYDKHGNYKEAKVFKDGRVEPPGAKLPKGVIEKAKDLLPAALLFMGELLDPFDAEALANPEEDADNNGIPDYLENSSNPCGGE